jgi:hypothetical protein
MVDFHTKQSKVSTGFTYQDQSDDASGKRFWPRGTIALRVIVYRINAI